MRPRSGGQSSQPNACAERSQEATLTPLQGHAASALTVSLSINEPERLQKALLCYRRSGDTVFSGEVPAEVSVEPGVRERAVMTGNNR